MGLPRILFWAALAASNPMSAVSQNLEDHVDFRTGAGQAVLIDTALLYNMMTCAPWPQMPRFVSLEAEAGSFQTRRADVMAKDNSLHRSNSCLGKTFPGVELWFTPDPGFTGVALVLYTKDLLDGDYTSHLRIIAVD